MNITLYTGPSRLANLQELLHRTPVGSGRFCALVPDAWSAQRLERQAAAVGGNAALGIRVCTFDRLARMIAAMDGTAPARLSAHLRSALIREIVRSRIGEHSPWHEVSALPGFAIHTGTFLEDIRAGMGDASHSYELSAIAKAYESHLARLGTTDHEGLLLKALEGDAPERFARSFDGPFIIEGFYDLAPNQRELVTRLALSFRRCAVAITHDPERPALFSLADQFRGQILAFGAKEVTVQALPDTPLCRVQRAFTGESDTPQPVPDGGRGFEAHTFRSAEAEADWIAGTIRELLAEGTVQADDIMVVTRHMAGPQDPVRRAIHHHGLPIAGGQPIRLDNHPLVRCIITMLTAATMHDEELIRQVCQSSYTYTGTADDIVSGFDNRGWTSMLAQTDSPEGYTESVRRIIDEIGIRAVVEEEPNPALRKRDLAAFEMIDTLLDEFGQFYRPVRPMMNASEFVRLFVRFIGDAPPVVIEPDSRGVLLCELNHARYVERRVIFMTGLGNESYPAGHDRFSLHRNTTATLIRDRADREEPLLFHLAGIGAERLICTFPGIDDEGSDAGMSPYLRELMILAGSEPAVFHKGVPGASWEHGPVNDRGRFEMAVRVLAGTGQVVTACLDICNLDRSVKARLSDIFKRHDHVSHDDGVILQNEAVLHEVRRRWAADHPVAVTALEQYRGCPIRFWYRHVLGLTQDVLSPNGLDNRERGILLHEALAEIYQQWRSLHGTARITTSDLPEATSLMEDIMESVFVRMRHDLARLHPLVVQTERQMVKAWMAQVLTAEAGYFAHSPYVPDRFEQPFGSEDCLPLEIGEGDTALRIRGRIDRIDISSDDPACVRVVDYKTGSKTSRADIQNGLALQLPLYMEVVRKVLIPHSTVNEGCYYALRDAGFDAVKGSLTGCTVIDEASDEVIERACEYALEAISGIRAGQFPVPATCQQTCEWRMVCRGERRMAEEGQGADIEA